MERYHDIDFMLDLSIYNQRHRGFRFILLTDNMNVDTSYELNSSKTSGAYLHL